MWTLFWRARKPRVSSTISRAIIGSPPVTTTWRAGETSTAARMRSSVQSSPSGCHDVYGVSHHTQRKLQPLVRTNTEGTPTSEPSPWMEWKISAIRNAGLFESLAAQQAGIALPAWPALGVRVVATVRHAEIQAEIASQLHDLRLR